MSLKPGLPVSPGCYFHGGDRRLPFELSGNSSTVTDFWRWAFSLVNENTTRGILAQYIVAWALGENRRLYDAWAPYDLLFAGKRIEVKCAAKAQIWEHGEESRKPQFIVSEKCNYTHEEGLDCHDVDFHADVYALCHYKYENSDDMDATDLSHWEFWILSKKQLLDRFTPRPIKKGKSEKPRLQVRASVDALRSSPYCPVSANKIRDSILSL